MGSSLLMTEMAQGVPAWPASPGGQHIAGADVDLLLGLGMIHRRPPPWRGNEGRPIWRPRGGKVRMEGRAHGEEGVKDHGPSLKSGRTGSPSLWADLWQG